MKRNYIGFAQTGDVFGPAQGEGQFCPKLPVGHYKVAYNNYLDELVVTRFEPHLDAILNLGCKEFNYAANITERFLHPIGQASFENSGFLWKRSFLFHGPPGTGKSVLATKIANMAVETVGALALYPKDHQGIERMFEVLDSTDVGRFRVIVLEEFDTLVGTDESDWTTLLDGQFQSNNCIIVATTNHVNLIPKRLLRPGRFSSLIAIPHLLESERAAFLKSKGIAKKLAAEIVRKTKNFTVDDLKEVVQCVVLLGQDLNSTVASIRFAKKLGSTGEEEE